MPDNNPLERILREIKRRTPSLARSRTGNRRSILSPPAPGNSCRVISELSAGNCPSTHLDLHHLPPEFSPLELGTKVLQPLAPQLGLALQDLLLGRREHAIEAP
jgi:hypothetical protein